MSAATEKSAAADSRHTWLVLIAAGTILTITMGMRQSLGFFVAPIIGTTHVSYEAMSFALAVGQLMWGLSQPVFGLLSDRVGAGRVLVTGAMLLALGNLLTTVSHGELALIASIGVLTAAGAGAGSFSLLIGLVARHVSASRRSFAAGFVNAGGSVGQMLMVPLNNAIIGAFGWVPALWTMAAAAIATIPIARPLLREPPATTAAVVTGLAPSALSWREQLGIAARDKSYWCLHLGFFTCGFHISFLVSHLPRQVALCSLSSVVASTSLGIIGGFNILGSLLAGWAGGVMRMKWVLFVTYFGRAVAIALFLVAPKTALTFYLFAAVLGFTWLATVPPTAGLIGKLFGVRYLATLFGFALLSHQIGGFFGAWLGGKALSAFGDFAWMWYADIALALAAAFVNVPIREAPLRAAEVVSA